MNDEKPGPTGLFPKGKVNKHDQGEIVIGVAADRKNGKVIIDFGMPVKWLAFDPVQAREIAAMLFEKAKEAETPVLVV